MPVNCPCNRSCNNCEYVDICGGCLEDNCIHIRIKERKTSTNGCLFCHKKGIDSSQSCTTLIPPKKIDCISPWVLEDTIDTWMDRRESLADQKSHSHWPLLIPEVSEISRTTSRLNVKNNEGEWKFNKWNSVAWDMTGYLIDKVQGTSWISVGESEEDSWRSIIGNDDNWIEDFLMVDRLPDYLAIQTPPSTIIAEYLNRLHACQWNLESDDDAPDLWMVTHGYPSYIDWPPAWHWNLGIRMLSSLIEYVGTALSYGISSPNEIWYPDKTRKTKGSIKAPYVDLGKDSRLLFPPHKEMDWLSFPGIIPFIPGADINQISWFAKQITGWGYDVLALDAMNTISHENYRGISEATNALKKAGAAHVVVYGPWPLQIPSKYTPRRDVSYIPTAHQMDMINSPARFWLSQESRDMDTWQKIPNYRTTPLSEIRNQEALTICSCSACKSARDLEKDPRSIWKWGHFLSAGRRWQEKMTSNKNNESAQLDDLKVLWYQGPASTAFRKCLHHIDTEPHYCIEDFSDFVIIDETNVRVQYPDGLKVSAEYVRWSDWKGEVDWREGFPKLEDL